PEVIPQTRKQRFLLNMSEDKFRDVVVRPLFKKMKLRDGRDLCGPDEEGKDAAFLAKNQLGKWDLWVVQTKRGRLNMTSDARSNVLNAVTQLKMALQTTVTLVADKTELYPSKAILCASGGINKAARQHILKEVKDARLTIMDVDDLLDP